MEHKDVFLLEAIVNYCDELMSAIQKYSIDLDVITHDPGACGMVAFFVMQIGETTQSLSQKFRERHPEIEWGMIIGMRVNIVHAYGKIIPDILWDTVINDIPQFRAFCASQIGMK